jgi:hypothetical protein
MRKSSYVTMAVASAAVLALCANYEPAAAQKNGGHGGGHGGGAAVGSGGGGAGIRSGGRAFGGSPGVRSYSAPRVQSHVSQGGGGRSARHFRGGRSFGYAPYGVYDGGYSYGGGCGYYYQRAVETGSAYWWDRYYDCAGE